MTAAAHFARAVSRFARGEKLPVEAIHPSVRFTRLGAVLREHAAEDSTVGMLSRAAILQPADQGYDTLPLAMLRVGLPFTGLPASPGPVSSDSCESGQSLPLHRLTRRTSPRISPG
jgi:hypothetical protein